MIVIRLRPRSYAMSTSYGDWPFYRDIEGRWRCKKTHELAIVTSLADWLKEQERDHGK